MEARVNIPSHEQSTKRFLPDVIRGWLVLQRSGLSESSAKTVLGSTKNTLGRSRIVESLKQQWPDHELLAYDRDRKGDRDRKMRAYVRGETDERELEMHPNETATESAQARAIMPDIKSSRGGFFSSRCKQERLRSRTGQR